MSIVECLNLLDSSVISNSLIYDSIRRLALLSNSLNFTFSLCSGSVPCVSIYSAALAQGGALSFLNFKRIAALLLLCCSSSNVSLSAISLVSGYGGGHKGGGFEVENIINKINIDFLEWFIGLSEAESNFTIRIRQTSSNSEKDSEKDQTNKKIRGFEFLFRIYLHLDDLKALEYIKSNLNCGIIKKDRNTYVFIISSFDDIKFKLLPIFDTYNLNGIKHLDYLSFKEAFILYTNRSVKADNPDLIDQILNLKNSMNDQRKNFLMPKEHSIKITDYYLLGFIEGDGSFFLSKSNFYTYISLGSISLNLPLLLKIKEFLISKPKGSAPFGGGMDENSKIFVENSKLINIYTKEYDGKKKSFSTIQFYNIDYIHNIIIPFFSKLEFKTKKALDFQDFKILVSLIYQGKHLIPEGESLIYNIADRMNNNRLSTNTNTNKKKLNSTSYTYSIDDIKIKSILDLPPLVIVDSEGRAKNTLNYQYFRTVCIIVAHISYNYTKEIKILKFHNVVSCSEYFNLSYSLINSLLNKGDSYKYNDEIITLKRIRIFN